MSIYGCFFNDFYNFNISSTILLKLSYEADEKKS